MSVIWRGKALLADVKRATEEALQKSAELVEKRWKDTIPYSSGDLASHVQNQRAGEMSYIISSTGPYARRQELDESLRHPNPEDPRSRSGRRVHAGRDSLDENRDNIEKLVAAEVDAVTR